MTPDMGQWKDVHSNHPTSKRLRDLLPQGSARDRPRHRKRTPFENLGTSRRLVKKHAAYRGTRRRAATGRPVDATVGGLHPLLLCRLAGVGAELALFRTLAPFF